MFISTQILRPKLCVYLPCSCACYIPLLHHHRVSSVPVTKTWRVRGGDEGKKRRAGGKRQSAAGKVRLTAASSETSQRAKQTQWIPLFSRTPCWAPNLKVRGFSLVGAVTVSGVYVCSKFCENRKL